MVSDNGKEEKIKKIQKYLPKGLTEKILSQKDRIEGERKQVTVLFADVKGSMELAEQVDFIAVHMLPYWEGVDVDHAVDHVLRRHQELQQAYPDKPVVISEVGWPSHGRSRQDAVASQANQAKFLRRFLAAAEREDITYYLMEAFDQPWKQQIEGEVGSHWGVYDDAREPKFAFTAPVVPVPNWTSLAAISIGLSVLVLALLFRDSRGLSSGGAGFLGSHLCERLLAHGNDVIDGAILLHVGL